MHRLYHLSPIYGRTGLTWKTSEVLAGFVKWVFWEESVFITWAGEGSWQQALAPDVELTDAITRGPSIPPASLIHWPGKGWIGQWLGVWMLGQPVWAWILALPLYQLRDPEQDILPFCASICKMNNNKSSSCMLLWGLIWVHGTVPGHYKSFINVNYANYSLPPRAKTIRQRWLTGFLFCFENKLALKPYFQNFKLIRYLSPQMQTGLKWEITQRSTNSGSPSLKETSDEDSRKVMSAVKGLELRERVQAPDSQGSLLKF